MFLVLMLSLLPDGDWKDTKVLCTDYQYTFTRDGDETVYISIDKLDYRTSFTNEAKLRTEIKRQCGK